MFRYGFGLHHGPHVFALLFLALLIAAVVLGAVLCLRSWRYARAGVQSGSWTTPAERVDPAFTELRIRYARGELTWEEYAQRAATLGFPVAPPPGPSAGPTPPKA